MTESNSFSLSGMSAESGFEDEKEQGLRISGFLSLIVGAFGFLGMIAPVLVVVGLVAVALAFFARRKYQGVAPVGYGVALIGGFLGMFFAAAGFFTFYLERSTMTGQAEQFAREYIKLVAMDEPELALELKKRPINRFLKGMSLKEYYARQQAEKDRELEANPSQRATMEGSGNMVVDFRDEGVNKKIRQFGVDAEWEIEDPPRFFYNYGDYKADVWLSHQEPGEKPFTIFMRLIVEKKDDTDVFQWTVEHCMVKMKRLVAESIL